MESPKLNKISQHFFFDLFRELFDELKQDNMGGAYRTQREVIKFIQHFCWKTWKDIYTQMEDLIKWYGVECVCPGQYTILGYEPSGSIKADHSGRAV
jgi:hypothetical protein